MFKMLSAVICALICRSAQQKVSLDQLSKSRMRFEDRVVEGSPNDFYTRHILSMTLDTKVFGYYPFGKSDRRFLVDFTGPSSISYQVLVGNKVQTVWHTEIRHTHRKPKFKGTFAIMLRQKGFEVWGPVSPLVKKVLDEMTPFAAYGYLGQFNAELYAWTVQVSGLDGPWYSLGDVPLKTLKNIYPITPEESEALGHEKKWCLEVLRVCPFLRGARLCKSVRPTIRSSSSSEADLREFRATPTGGLLIHLRKLRLISSTTG